MNKVKTFFFVLKNSLTKPIYYRSVLKAPISFSIKFLYSFVVFILFIQVSFFSVQAAFLLPQLPEAITVIEKRLNSLYPQNLVITVTDGNVRTNVKEPVFIDFPEIKDAKYDHFITIDTNSSHEDYSELKTFFLVTKKEVVYPESTLDGSRYQSAPLERIENTTVTRHDYDLLLGDALPFLTSLPQNAPYYLLLGVFVIPLVAGVFQTVGYLIQLLILSFMTWAIAQLFGISLSYKKAFQLGLHAIAAPILLLFFLQATGNAFPLVFTSGFLLWIVIILSKLNKVTE